MPLLIAGFTMVFAGLFGWGWAAGFGWLRYQPETIPRLMAAMVVAPMLAAWMAAELANLASPRRIFDQRRRTRVRRFILGAFAGGLSALTGAAVLPLTDRFVPDAVVFGGASVLAMGAVVLSSSRTRPGHCIHCGYDLRQSPAPGQPGAGRCAECGAEIVARRETSRIGPALEAQIP